METGTGFLYTYACHEDEAELRGLEMEALFGRRGTEGCLWTEHDVSVQRSPFFKRRVKIEAAARELPDLLAALPDVALEGRTFKVLYTPGDERHTYEERRQLERLAGAAVRGKADMRRPDRPFGLVRYRGRWLFGPCEEHDASWQMRQRKPQNYSTALPVRAARAIVNIAAGPDPRGMKLIDPCCGMGTVLIEALSMGISIEGLDSNPLAVRGARTNLAHFGYRDAARLGDMKEWQGSYDAAIVDLPYNLCSVLPSEERMAMLAAVRNMADKAVIVATDDLSDELERVSLRIIRRAQLRKGSFVRYITVVE